MSADSMADNHDMDAAAQVMAVVQVQGSLENVYRALL